MIDSAVRAYRVVQVQAATPVGMVVMLYDAALASLRRAMEASRKNDVQQRTSYINHVLEIVCHLQATLDTQHGGEVAQTLWTFYDYARRNLLEASFSNSVEKMAEVETQLDSVRGAWHQVNEANLKMRHADN